MADPSPEKPTEKPNEKPLMTPRQKIITELRNGAMTSKDLSREVHITEKEVIAHLKHVAKSIRPPEQLIINAPACNQCGFVFEDRKRHSIPSRCPKCRHEGIHPPVFRIET